MNQLSTRKVDPVGTFAAISALLCWSLAPIFIEYLTGHTDAWTQNALRYATASLFWLPFLIVYMKAKRVDKSIWKKAIIPAAANIILQTCWAYSLYYIQPAFMILLTKSSIIWIAAFSLVFFAEERTLVKSPRFLSGMILSTTGVVGVLVYQKNFTATATMTGIVFALTAAFMWSFYTITAKIAFRNIDSRTGFSVVSIYTMVGLVVLAFAFGRPVYYITEMDAQPWIAVIVSGIICIAFSHVLYYVAMKRIGATIPSLILLLQPFNIIALSYIFFGEKLNTCQWFFGIILLTGFGLAIWAQQHLAPKPKRQINLTKTG